MQGPKRNSERYVKFAIYAIAVILLNAAGLTFFFRIDLTRNRIYSLSEVSRQAVATLTEPLTVKVFFTRNLPAPYNNVERYLQDLLQEYALYANQFFNFRFYNVSPEAGDVSAATNENRQLANDYGIHPVQIQVVEKDEIKFKQAYMGVVLIHGDIIERLPTLTSTDGLEYMLTTTMQKLNNKVSALLGLSQKIDVKLFLSSSLEQVAPYLRLDNLARLPEAVSEIVDRLNAKNYDKLAFEHLDPTADPGLQQAVRQHDVLNLRWPELRNGELPSGDGAIGLVIAHDERSVSIPLVYKVKLPLIGTHYEMVPLEELADIIERNVETLIDINQDLGYLADHGGVNLQGGPQQRAQAGNFRQMVSQTYSLKPVRLEDGPVADSLQCLVIPGPGEAFTEYELYLIDQFLMQGKNLALFLDAFAESAPAPNRPPQFSPLDTGLNRLLAHYGVKIEPAFVLDQNCFKQRLPQRLGGGERPIYFAPLIQNRQINQELPFMESIKGLVTVQVAPLSLDEERLAAQDIQARRLLASSEQSWKMTAPINLNPMAMQPPAEEEQTSYPLAYLLEGAFSSYFAGKPIPPRTFASESENSEPAPDAEAAESQPAEDGPPAAPTVDLERFESEGTRRAQGRPGRIFIMASSQMLKDTVIEGEGRTPNDMFVMNVLDYLNGREGVAAMRSKQQRFNPLEESTAFTKTALKAFNIAGLPILVGLFGLCVWFRRHGRKKRIQAQFQAAGGQR